ncbi:MAG: hypothetical protein ACM3H7_08015 [Acidobacteriaceae bacterium]
MDSQKDTIDIGCHVDLNLVDRHGVKEGLGIDIVVDEAADFAHGFLGVSTPLAKVLLGEKAGTVIPYLKDDISAIEVLRVSPSTSKPSEKATEQRRARLKEITREVEHTSAVVFASSFSGKWGDYDPDSLLDEEDKEEETDRDS